jgi:hypothetical protein
LLGEQSDVGSKRSKQTEEDEVAGAEPPLPEFPEGFEEFIPKEEVSVASEGFRLEVGF